MSELKCPKCSSPRATELPSGIKKCLDCNNEWGIGRTNSVYIKDIKMSFPSMVIFMVKWVIASIPALIILFMIGMILTGIFGVGIATLFR